MRLAVRALTAEAFSPYGRVIERPRRNRDASGPGWEWWAETLMLDGDPRPWGIGYLDLQPTDLRFDWAERHLRSPEGIVPLGGGCFVYVGPADHLDEPAKLPPFERFEVFRVPAGAGVVMDPGVWHGAPFADGRPGAAIVLLLEGTPSDDVTKVTFEDTPVEIDATTRPEG
jgi:ureidoglycolate hydrolase